MSRFHSYINSAAKILETYTGDKPFAVFLKQYFTSHKKFGSNDRKQVAALCYNYFRLGHAAQTLETSERMLLGTFLCEEASSKILEQLKPEWNELVAQPLAEKLSVVKNLLKLEDIFPFKDALSAGVDHNAFCTSLLIQPDLFLRIRPAAKVGVEKKLIKSGLAYGLLNDDCVQLPPTTNVEAFFEVDKEVVIQDFNSQQVLNFLKRADTENVFADGQINSWDCCAASGGKSILLKDIFNKRVNLTISDVRPGIILNLHQRFKRAGIKEYNYFISDVSQPDATPTSSNYELVICDAPCTGSGTWSRTPEQLHFFNEASITHYSELQRKIVVEVVKHLRAGGIFVYITCSLFRAENEELTRVISEELGCEKLFEEVLMGYDKKADTMYVSVFKKR